MATNNLKFFHVTSWPEAASAVTGGIYFNKTTGEIAVWNGTDWEKYSGTVKSVVWSGSPAGDSGSLVITNFDGSHTAIDFSDVASYKTVTSDIATALAAAKAHSDAKKINGKTGSDITLTGADVALTGYKKDWLQVCIEGQSEKDRILIIKATVPEDKDEDGKQYVKRRMRVSSFEKKYRIPQGYDTDATEVSYEDGLLTVYIPVKKVKVFKPTVKHLEIN